MRRSASAVARDALRSVSSRSGQCNPPLAHLDLPASAPLRSTTRLRIFFSQPPIAVDNDGRQRLEGWLRGSRPRAFASSTSDDHQERLLEHYAMGLRGILASVENLDDAKLAGKLRDLRDEAPVKLAYKFWGSQFLAMAFGHEARLGMRCTMQRVLLGAQLCVVPVTYVEHSCRADCWSPVCPSRDFIIFTNGRARLVNTSVAPAFCVEDLFFSFSLNIYVSACPRGRTLCPSSVSPRRTRQRFEPSSTLPCLPRRTDWCLTRRYARRTGN